MAESSKSGRPNVFHFLIRLYFSVLRSSCLIKRVDEMWKQKKAKVPIKCYLTGTFAFFTRLGLLLGRMYHLPDTGGAGTTHERTDNEDPKVSESRSTLEHGGSN